MSPRLAGCCGFGKSRITCFRRLRLVEIQETFFCPPRIATLHQWRMAAPADFTFTIRAWQLITHEPQVRGYPRLPKNHSIDLSQCGHFRATDAVRQATARTIEVADALGAAAIVFESPASFTPTSTNRSRLTRFFDHLHRRDDRLLVWNPQGIWSGDEVTRICADLRILPCSVPPQPVDGRAYVRLAAPRYTDDDLVQLAAAVLPLSHALCVFNSLGMLRDALRLEALLTQPSNN